MNGALDLSDSFLVEVFLFDLQEVLVVEMTLPHFLVRVQKAVDFILPQKYRLATLGFQTQTEVLPLALSFEDVLVHVVVSASPLRSLISSEKGLSSHQLQQLDTILQLLLLI